MPPDDRFLYAGYNEGMWSLVAALLLFAVPPDDPSAAGLKALEAENYELAAQNFSRAAAADPKDYGAQFHLALANSMLGKDAEAIAGYTKVLELKPGLYQAELNLGILLLRGKRGAEALAHFEAAAAQKPQEPRPRLYLAEAQLETGAFANAEASYKAVLDLDPKSAVAELGIAQALLGSNRIAEAEPHFRRAAELDPKYKSALLELAERYQKSGQTDQAIALYLEFPEEVAVRERLGELLVEAGRAAEAIPHLEWAVAHSPSTANRVALAQAYRKDKQNEKAIPLLDQAVTASPQDTDLRMAYGRALRDQRRFADAAAQFLRVTQAKPDFVPAWNELSGMLISLENFPQALAALDRVRALGAETPGHMYLRAIVLDRIKDVKGALESYKRFLAASEGKHPDEEFKARQRARILQVELDKR
jgi:tetratricopeptide (TPR) repeat protein